jgi:hypothetical protein
MHLMREASLTFPDNVKIAVCRRIRDPSCPNEPGNLGVDATKPAWISG